jgi:L-histidine N-alpha-methyltransferase
VQDQADAVGLAVPDRPDIKAMLRDVRNGLSQQQKELDPKYFYDERGSDLFEQITRLPEYYPTRAERRLLEATMPYLIDDIRPASLVELGAGSASKTRVILDAMQESGNAIQYVPVDVSADFLAETARRLRDEYPGMRIDPAVADFSSDLQFPVIERRALFAFLGSTIGNFSDHDAVAILARIASHMRADDAFILGVDLRKDHKVIEAAYNDAAGVTAEFNLNVLRVLNRELGADFDLTEFRHRAFYDPERHRIEMHLVANSDQTIRIPEIGEVTMLAGESIRTELSHKYNRVAVASLFDKAGLCLEKWLTGEDEAFAIVVGSRRWARV